MWSHSHVMWFWESSYSQLIWFQNADVFGQSLLCSQFATGRGSLFVSASAIASCLEIITSKPIPNVYRVSFGPKVSPEKAQSYWAPIVEAMLPFCAQLQPAVDNVLRDEKLVAASIASFRNVLASIRTYHAQTFQEFTKHINLLLFFSPA